MPSPPEAWWFNLDAEREFEAGAAFRTDVSIARRAGGFIARFPSFLRPVDRVIRSDEVGMSAGFVGRCWSPTPSALARLREAGFSVPDAPSLGVLRRVNHRAFALDLEAPSDRRAFVEREAEVHEWLLAGGPTVRWRLKQPWGFGGRGHRCGVRADWTERDRRWIRHACEMAGGLLIEPEVQRLADYTYHGWLERDGAVRFGEPCVQRCDDRGAWTETVRARAGDLDAATRQELRESAERVADALNVAGYFGPFGCDAFHWRDEAGAIHLRPLVDLNARFTTGWFLGMHPWRPGTPSAT